jgi:hypothetical protein
MYDIEGRSSIDYIGLFLFYVMEIKFCVDCKEEKSVSEFYAKGYYKGVRCYTSECKKCNFIKYGEKRRISRKEFKKRHPEKIKADKKKHFQRHKEDIQEKNKIRLKNIKIKKNPHNLTIIIN